MRISHEDHGPTALVAVAGDLLSDDCEIYQRSVSERFDSGICNIVLDVTGLESIDSSGLEALLWTVDEAASRSGRMKLVGVAGVIDEVLRVTRLARRFDIEQSVESAARSLR